jgi:probable phosphoglycerate mutase
MGTTRVLLVRHGQSEWNASGRWQGQADPPLSDLGRQQARSAAQALGALDAVFASDLQRATETATIIAGLLGIGPVIVDPDLRERDAGEWSGLTRPEIEERYPGYLDSSPGFGPAGERKRPPGWETDESVRNRALRAIARIAEEVDDGHVLAVTHGGLIYVVEHHLGHDGPIPRLANGAGRWIDVDGERITLGERVLLVDEHDAPVTTPHQI